MGVDVIYYEELTWPEVAALPRDLTLVLPLGSGYDMDEVAAALNTDQVCLLPALPYGWMGSLVDVGESLLRRTVAGIFSGSHDDGFTHLVVVYDGVEDLNQLGIHHLRVPPRERINKLSLHATSQQVILIPCGHTEQHGYHLPMNTDTIIIGAITDGIILTIPDQAETLPVLPYGVSTHRNEFSGTFNMGGRVFEDFMLAIIKQLVTLGADRFYLMSGHGGNCSFLVNVVKYAGERHPGIFAVTSWLHTSGRIASSVVQRTRRSGQGGMGHAGELETAYMLHLRPDLCHMDRVVDETNFISTEDYYMDWVEGGSLIANPPWSDDTVTGSYGAGSVATAENGKRWLAVGIEEKIGYVQEIHEQQNRRIIGRH